MSEAEDHTKYGTDQKIAAGEQSSNEEGSHYEATAIFKSGNLFWSSSLPVIQGRLSAEMNPGLANTSY